MIAYLTLPCSYVKKVCNYKKKKKKCIGESPKTLFFSSGFLVCFSWYPSPSTQPKTSHPKCLYVYSFWCGGDLWECTILLVVSEAFPSNKWCSCHRGQLGFFERSGQHIKEIWIITTNIWYIILYNPYFSSQIHIDMGNHPFLLGGLEHLLWLSIYGECHDPNWRVVHHFPEGLKSTTNQIIMKTIINHHHNH